MNDLKDKIVAYLVEKYNPTAVILHGSRANGHARQHSDWDFILLTNKEVGIPRFIEFGENIEVKEFLLPIPDDKVDETFGRYFYRENLEICYDPQNLVPDLISKKEASTKKGYNIKDADRIARFAFLKSFLNSIIDYKDEPLIVFSKKAEFYTATLHSWFKFVRNEPSVPNYLALPYIQKEDSEFYDLLNEFVAANAGESVVIGNKIIQRLFPDLFVAID